MRYQLKIESRAKKDLQALGGATQKRIAKKLKFFIEQDDPIYFAKQLVNSKDGDYRWRVGHYRVVFDIDNDTIRLLRIQHRKDVYK